MFDVGEHGEPMAAWTGEEVRQVLAGFAEMIAAGTSLTVAVTRLECRGHDGAGFCAVEFDQSFTNAEGTMGPLHFRGTLVAEKHPTYGWKWTHWHGSFAEIPGGSPPTPAAAAE
jgi:ketosteroid isomerase-like protein